MTDEKRERIFELDPVKGRIVIGRVSIPVPRSRTGRIALGSGLILCGTLGFLPILGFWMLPLGVLVLSQDVPAFRRLKRRAACWWGRRRRTKSRRV